MEDPTIRTCRLLCCVATLAFAPTPALAGPESQTREALYVDARIAEMLGDSDRAARRYSQLSTALPDDGQLRRRALSEAIAAGRFDLALDLAQRGDFAVLEAQVLQLAHDLRQRNFAAALARVNDDEGPGSTDFLAPFVRGWVGVATSRGRDRIAAVDRLAAMGSERPLSRQRDAQLVLMALASGDPTLAIPRIDSAIATAGPRQGRLRLAFAQMLADLDRRDLADTLLVGTDPILVAAREKMASGKSLEMAVTTPAAGLSELLLAAAVEVAGEIDSPLPLTLAQIARYADPDNDSAAIIAAALLEREGDTDEAIALYRSVPENSLLSSQAEDGIVQGLLSAERPREALEYARTRVEAAPRRLGAWARLGDTHSALDQHEAAATAYARERGLRGEDADWTLLFLEGVARDSAGDWEGAEALFNLALRLHPDQPVVLNYLGYNLLERGERLGEASAFVRRASRLRPDSAAITDSLGWALYKLGEHEEAVETLDRAARMAPDDPEIFEHLGDALSTTGRPIEARFAWEAALASTEEDAMSDRLRDKLAYGLMDGNAAP